MTLPVLLPAFGRSQEALQEPGRLVEGALGTLVLRTAPGAPWPG